MKEVNGAYEAITKMRSGGGYQNSYSAGGYQYQQRAQTDPVYQRVRQQINAGDLNGAEETLRQTPGGTAEYYFLAGSIAYRRGWLDEARQNYNMACQLDPGNMEYRRAAGMMNQGGYAYGHQNMSAQQCDSCDICTSMMLLNCLCGGCN